MLSERRKAQFEEVYVTHVTERLTNKIIGMLGALCVIAGIPVHALMQNEVLETVLFGVGCSLFASAVISYLMSLYVFKRQKEKAVTEEWGLEAIYRTRQEMNVACDESMKRTKDEIDMVGFGFGSLRFAKDAEVKEMVGHGLKLRILTMHPDCKYAARRDEAEHDAPGHTRHTICELADWIEELRAIAPEPDAIQVKYYDALPLDFYFRTDDRVFVGPYMYGIGSQQTISYEFLANGSGADYYARYFERLWSDDNKSVPKKPFLK